MTDTRTEAERLSDDLDTVAWSLGNESNPQELARLIDTLEAENNEWVPQDYQAPPDGEWWMWVFCGGAGSGKTDTGAYWMDHHMKGPPCDPRLPGGHKGIICGPTFADAITTCWQYPAGISAHNDTVKLIGRKDGTHAVWPNGADAQFAGLHSLNDVELLRARAANCCTWWIDEAALASNLKLVVDLISMRARGGNRPHGIVTSTPQPTPGWKYLVAQPGVVQSRGSSYQNAFLSEVHRQRLKKFEGTRMEAQEIYGLLIDDFEGALWKRESIDSHRYDELPQLMRIAIGVDPSVWVPPDPGVEEEVTYGEGIETGIVAVGIDDQSPPHVYVLRDESGRYAAERWGQIVVNLFHELNDLAPTIIVPETNAGGGQCLATIRLIDPDVRIYSEHGKPGVRASVGKRARADDVTPLYDQGRAHHPRHPMELLEGQMCGWDPTLNWSPDRLDALVWAVFGLKPWGHAHGGGYSAAGHAIPQRGSLTAPRPVVGAGLGPADLNHLRP